jgi:Regulator of ribonuclease activity B
MNLIASDGLPCDSDGDALRRLLAHGSDLSRPMDIDFTVDVPDRKSGEEFAKVIAQEGFATDVDQDAESLRWTCYCTRTMVPEYDAIIAIQEMIDRLGRPYGARSDGWGSFGNAPD